METKRAPSGGGPTGAGSRVVLAMVGLAAALAVFAVWFQWRQTHRCLAFYGPTVAEAIQKAPRVEVWDLQPSGDRVRAMRTRDISTAAGLVHLRHGLVEDANFSWRQEAAAPLPPAAWDRGLAFFDAEGSTPAAVLAIDAEGEGWLTVVGQPGRIGLGRIRRGLHAWLAGLDAGQPAAAPRAGF